MTPSLPAQGKLCAPAQRTRPRGPAAFVFRGLALAAVLVVAASCGGDDDDNDDDAAESGAIAGVRTFEIKSRDHVDPPVDYAQTPPVGGPHSQVWMNCGAYSEPVPDEQAVHSLEHGAAWIAYRSDLDEAAVTGLAGMAESQTYLLVSPYPDLPVPVVVSAWGVQLQLDSPDDPRLAEFLDEYRQGPQTPEPGAPCTGGAASIP